MNSIRRAVHVALPVRREEFTVVAWSFAWFFFLLGGYYSIRPFRETFGTSVIKTKNIPFTFVLVFFTMLAITPIYGALVSRIRRDRLIPIVYAFFGVWLFWFQRAHRRDAIGLYTACMFYVWVGVFNYFVVSLFWSFLTDVYSEEQGKRLFGIVAAGGTIGGILGSVFTAKSIEHRWLHPSTVLLAPVGCLIISCACMKMVDRYSLVMAGGTWKSEAHRPAGGSPFSGITNVLSSRYLMLITTAVVLTKFCATGPYVLQTVLVPMELESQAQQTILFAKMNFWTQVLTVSLQAFVAGRLIKHWGLTVALATLPAAYLIGLGTMAVVPLLTVLVVVIVAGRTIGFGISTPANQVLFTVVSREDRYKSKSFIDTVISRGSDAVASSLIVGLFGLGLGPTAVSLALLPIAIAWLTVSIVLGRMQHKLAIEAAQADTTA